MENEKNEISIFERLSNWSRSSVTLKLASITFLTLMLLIPQSMVEDLIQERQEAKAFATNEVNNIWANSQVVSGPIITVPFIVEIITEGKISRVKKFANFLPDDLSVNGNISPESLKRGIYKIVVYKSKLDIKANFEKLKNFPNAKEVLWNEAYLTFGISDLRGIRENLNLKINGKVAEIEAGTKNNSSIKSGVTVLLNDINEETTNIPFSISLDLQGSNYLKFIPMGKTTSVKLSSSWDSPSFIGNFSPKERVVNEEGFSAYWKVLDLNRNFPQSWINNQYSPSEDSSFGVNLLLSVDDYQRSMRSVKYSLMTIVLVFLVFFLTEIINKKKIHAFQYTLVGLAIILFYTLLVSISEHTNFNVSYLLSSIIVTTMIGLYSISIFNNMKLSIILVLTIVGIFTFIFVTLQLEEFALLIGTVGLTAILGITMYSTKNIKWNKD
ncbi:MAG: cell envelope integrity protein CreD [Bacteroidota bacterium]